MTALMDFFAEPVPPAASSTVESPFIVRVAGMPASTLIALSAPELREAIRDTIAAGAWLAAEGAALADELHGVIGALAEDPLKPRLIGLRRALFRAKPPKAAEWDEPIRAAVPDEIRRRIVQWTERLTERDRTAGKLTEIVDRARDRTRSALLDAVADSRFRHGIAQSSPDLSAELEKWLARKTSPPRQVIVRLVRYLSRAAAKTSPYSTFTTIGAGSWTSEPGERLTVSSEATPHGRLEFHGAVLAELAHALSTSDELRPALLVRVNPSLTPIGDRLAALGRPPREEIVSVAALPEVRACLAVLGDGWLTLGELRARMASSATADSAKIGAFVDRLIDIGLLELRPPVDDQCPDPFGALADWLGRAGGDLWAGTARCCAELSRLLTVPTDLDDVAGHRMRLATIRHATDILRAEADLPEEPGGGDFVHEHTVFTTPVATASLPAWRDALDDLDVVRRWMAVYDPGLPLRLALGAYCAARFGAGSSVPFIAFHRRLLADLEAGGVEIADLHAQLRPQPSIQDSLLPELRELEAIRRQTTSAVLDQPPDGDGVVRVDPARLAVAALVYPGSVRPADSVAWFVQADGPRLVLNTAVSGYGRGRSRSLHLIASANGGRLPDGIEPSTSDGETVVADSSGAFGHTLNLRVPLNGHELDYPFTLERTARARIPLRDLAVEHDAATGLAGLRWLSRDCPVTPVHTGMMAEFLLPFGLQVLIRGLGVAPTLFPPGGLLPRDHAPAGVLHTPRVEAGLIVLRRATWSVPVDQVPRREPGEPDARLLLRLHGWLAQHGIPDRCFVRASAPPGPTWLASAFTKTRKPLYVDFASPWLVAMFERLIAAPTERVVFREALPDPCDADPRVTELVIETAAGV